MPDYKLPYDPKELFRRLRASGFKAHNFEDMIVYCYDHQPNVYNELIQSQDSNEVEPILTTSKLYSKGFEAEIMGDFGEAIRYYRMTLARDPHYPRAEERLYHLLGQHRLNWEKIAAVIVILLAICIGAFIIRWYGDDFDVVVLIVLPLTSLAAYVIYLLLSQIE